MKTDVLLVGYENQANLGLRSIASYLIDKGYKVSIQQFRPDAVADILQAALASKPLLIGFSLIFQYTLSEFSEIIKALRKKHRMVHLTAGGHYPSLRPAETFKLLPELDSIVRFEGEEALHDLVAALKTKVPWTAIPGLAFKSKRGLQLNQPRPLIDPLDSLPWPLRNKVNKNSTEPYPSSPMLASRGCLYDCAFCSIREFYRGTTGTARRSRSPQDVVAEMSFLFHHHGTKVFLFQDDDFAMRSPKAQQWVEEFLEELDTKALSSSIAWKISARVDDIVNRKLLAKCKEKGLLAVYLGIESGNSAGLKTLNKRVTLEQNSNAIRLLHKEQIAFDLGFMLFDPDSTFETVAQNLDFLKKIANLEGPPLAFVKMLPLAGTAIERRLEKEGRLIGTALRPDYRLLDPRLEYFALFATLVFSHRNSDPNGFVEQFRRAYFMALLSEKFHGGHNATNYRKDVVALIRQGNKSALKLLQRTLDLVASQPDERSVALIWPALRQLANAEEVKWNRLLEQLNGLEPVAP